jgi:hypothetical protein
MGQGYIDVPGRAWVPWWPPARDFGSLKQVAPEKGDKCDRDSAMRLKALAGNACSPPAEQQSLAIFIAVK